MLKEKIFKNLRFENVDNFQNSVVLKMNCKVFRVNPKIRIKAVQRRVWKERRNRPGPPFHMIVQGVPLPHHIGSLLALNYYFRDQSDNLRKMIHFKKSYKAIVNIFLQKILGFSSIMCVFLSLKRKDNPKWYGTLCTCFADSIQFE